MKNNYWIKNRVEIAILSALSLIALYAISLLLYAIDYITGTLWETAIKTQLVNKRLFLKWNTDLKNENGLVVVVEWSGMYVTGQKENKYVRNIDVITDDNGSTTLKNEIFNGIPENAIAFITLLRGNIAIVDDYYSKQGNVDPYSLIAETHAILPFVLVRNLN